MAISELQSISKNPASVNSTTLAFASNVTAGSMLAAWVFQANTTAVFTMSDNVNGAWGTADANDIKSGNSVQGSLFTFPNSGSGALTVTFSSTQTAQARLIIAEFAGLATVSPLDKVSTAHGGASTNPSSGTTVATSQASELALGLYCSSSGSPTFTVDNASWTIDLQFASKLIAANQILTVAGTQEFGGTLSSSDFWVCMVATYKGAAAGPTAMVEGMSVQIGPAGTPC